MKIKLAVVIAILAVFVGVPLISPRTAAQTQRPSSYSPSIEEPFSVVLARDKAAKSRVMAAHQKLMEERYDLARRVDSKVTMTRGKPIPVGPTARLKGGITWEQLSKLSPDEIKDKNLFPVFATSARRTFGRRHGISTNRS